MAVKLKGPEKINLLLGDVLKRVTVGQQLPKDLGAALLASVENLRQGVQQTFAVEISRVLSKVDFSEIANDIASNYSLKVNAEIRLEPKKGKNKKKVKKI